MNTPSTRTMTASSTPARDLRALAEAARSAERRMELYLAEQFPAIQIHDASHDLRQARSEYETAANPSAILALLDRVERAEAEVARLRQFVL